MKVVRSEGDWSQGGRCRTKDAGFIYSLVLPPVDERFVTKKPVSLDRWTIEQHFGQDRSSQAGLGNGGTWLLPTPGGEGSARWFVALTHLCKCENFHRVKASLLEPVSELVGHCGKPGWLWLCQPPVPLEGALEGLLLLRALGSATLLRAQPPCAVSAGFFSKWNSTVLFLVWSVFYRF